MVGSDHLNKSLTLCDRRGVSGPGRAPPQRSAADDGGLPKAEERKRSHRQRGHAQRPVHGSPPAGERAGRQGEQRPPSLAYPVPRARRRGRPQVEGAVPPNRERGAGFEVLALAERQSARQVRLRKCEIAPET